MLASSDFWIFYFVVGIISDEGIDKETFLNLGDSIRINLLFPRIGPRVKFRKRLKDYLQVRQLFLILYQQVYCFINVWCVCFDSVDGDMSFCPGKINWMASQWADSQIWRYFIIVWFWSFINYCCTVMPYWYFFCLISIWILHFVAEEGIDKEAFLSLESGRINTLIPKIGPRVKFKRRLREYLQVMFY